MKRTTRTAELMRVLSMGRMESKPGQVWDWDAHRGVWEIEIQEEGTVKLGLDDEYGRMRPGDVALYPPQIRHACWNEARTSAYSLVIHFTAPRTSLLADNPVFVVQPGHPLGRLSADEMIWAQQLFHQLWWEDTMRHARYVEAEDALLRLLLIGLERIISGPQRELPPVENTPRDVMLFFGHLHTTLDQPQPLQAAAERLGSNYDSLRHRFRAALGVSPKQLLMKLRFQQARHLLLTTRLSIKEIAARVGYPDPQHFATAFAKATGQTPQAWRTRPVLGGSR